MRKTILIILFISVQQAYGSLPWFSYISYGPSFGGSVTSAKPLKSFDGITGLNKVFQPGFSTGMHISLRRPLTCFELGFEYASEGSTIRYKPERGSFEAGYVKLYQHDFKFFNIQMPVGMMFQVHEGTNTTHRFGFSVLPRYLIRSMEYQEIQYISGAKERDILFQKNGGITIGMRLQYGIEIPLLYDHAIRIEPYVTVLPDFKNYTDSQPNVWGFGLRNTFFINR